MNMPCLWVYPQHSRIYRLTKIQFLLCCFIIISLKSFTIIHIIPELTVQGICHFERGYPVSAVSSSLDYNISPVSWLINWHLNPWSFYFWTSAPTIGRTLCIIKPVVFAIPSIDWRNLNRRANSNWINLVPSFFLFSPWLDDVFHLLTGHACRKSFSYTLLIIFEAITANRKTENKINVLTWGSVPFWDFIVVNCQIKFKNIKLVFRI